jgi:hypothetical protein
VNTLIQLRSGIVQQIWADSQPENLFSAHNQIFLEGLSEIQKWVKCEQQRNANILKFCNTYFKCGTTVFGRPRGVISFVYTIANDDWCDPVFYKRGTLKEVECFRCTCREFTVPEDAVLPALPLGFVRANATADSQWGRAREGMWSLDGDNLVMSPSIQSNEKVVVEWRGIKAAAEWSDDDPISDALDFRKALKLYLQYGHERDYGDPNLAATIHNVGKSGTFDEALADLMWQCNEEMRMHKDEACRRTPTWAQITDDAVPTT